MQDLKLLAEKVETVQDLEALCAVAFAKTHERGIFTDVVMVILTGAAKLLLKSAAPEAAIFDVIAKLIELWKNKKAKPVVEVTPEPVVVEAPENVPTPETEVVIN